MADFPFKGELNGAMATTEKPSALVCPAPATPPYRHDNHVLASLPEAELNAIRRYIQILSLPPGVALQHHDFGPDHVYFPHSGVVSLLAVTPNGETIEVASAGRAAALCPILESEQRDSLLSTIAQGPLPASRIAVGRLQAAVANSEILGRALAACRGTMLLQLRQNVVCNGRHAVEHRLARWLLETADRLEAEMIPVTQEHVSQRLGVRRTTVTLLASKFQDIGAIRWGRSRIEIVDRPRLGTMACSCYRALHDRTQALLALGPTAPGS